MGKKFKKDNFFQGGSKNLLIAIVVFVGCIALLTKLTDYTQQIKTLSYSNFIKRVEQGDVKLVHVSGQDVQGAFADGTKFETVIPQNPTDWDLLKRQGVEVMVAAQSGPMNLWYLMLFGSFVLTLLAAWYFLRQSRGQGGNGGPGGGNIFSMGKSRAKLFMPSTIKENFDSVAGAAEAKEELKDVVDFLKNPEKYRRLVLK